MFQRENQTPPTQCVNWGKFCGVTENINFRKYTKKSSARTYDKVFKDVQMVSGGSYYEFFKNRKSFNLTIFFRLFYFRQLPPQLTFLFNFNF